MDPTAGGPKDPRSMPVGAPGDAASRALLGSDTRLRGSDDRPPGARVEYRIVMEANPGALPWGGTGLFADSRG